MTILRPRANCAAGRSPRRIRAKSTITVPGAGSPAPLLEVVKGKVPKGMKVTKKAGVLTISGTPKVTSLGRRTLTLTVTNATGSVTRMLTIVVKRA
ncbi:MAG TPA: putative Ig domain-containing protein [Nocardioides sp.]|nr:putative Ig domain-containing protein [Nocardioides sp.]